MKTKYLLTTTNPDAIDPDNFEDALENCEPFTNERRARRALKAWKEHTNMRVHLLKVEILDEVDGDLL